MQPAATSSSVDAASASVSTNPTTTTTATTTLQDPPPPPPPPSSSSSPPLGATLTSSSQDPPAETTAEPVELSYDRTEQSEYYRFAKDCLQRGEFEPALATIESGIQALTRRVQQQSTESSDDDVLEQALAPLHYLYGTTLLYAVEEASDEQNMTTLPEVKASQVGKEEDHDEHEAVAEEEEEDDDDNDDNHDGAEHNANDKDNAVTEEEDADDMEIAWENLETARSVLEKMLAATPPPPNADKLRLDLAQVLLREGDLQRMNSRYDQAVRDYSSCLTYRTTAKALMDPYDRRIADVHYNLGLSYLMQVADTKATTEEGENNEANHAHYSHPKESNRREELRGRAFYHYLQCGRTFCGLLASLCGLHAADFLQQADHSLAQLKSTGEEEAEEYDIHGNGKIAVDPPKVVSHKLHILSERVAQLEPPEEQQSLFEHVRELLIELRETVDEAEASELGVHQVTEMKAEIAAAVAGQAGHNDDNDEEATGADASNGFGSAAASARTAAAQPITMMMVKKKKKRDANDAGVVGSAADAKESKRLNASSE